MAQHSNAWPSLRVDDWAPTRDTLHMWTQIVGKVRLVHSPMVNHWWQVTLYVTPRGLTTSTIPYATEAFDIEFDFIDHQLLIRSSTGAPRAVALKPKSVAEFYSQTMQALDELGFPPVFIHIPTKLTMPCLSLMTASTRRTTVTPQTCSGASCSRPTAYSASFGPGSAAR